MSACLRIKIRQARRWSYRTYRVDDDPHRTVIEPLSADKSTLENYMISISCWIAVTWQGMQSIKLMKIK